MCYIINHLCLFSSAIALNVLSLSSKVKKKKILLKQRKYTVNTLERHKKYSRWNMTPAWELIAFPFIGATSLAELETCSSTTRKQWAIAVGDSLLWGWKLSSADLTCCLGRFALCWELRSGTLRRHFKALSSHAHQMTMLLFREISPAWRNGQRGT